MAANEKIRTEDVIEILDNKIITSQGHPAIGVLPGENYDSVLTKVETQVLTPEQKAAFDAALTLPGPTNPVVLKKDLDTYIPTANLGEFRDSVATFNDLPLVVTRTAILTGGSKVLTNISTLNRVLVGQKIEGLGIPHGTTVAEIYYATSSLKMTNAATETGSRSLAVGPVEGELRGVIAERVIYRWNGSEWAVFINTGTLDHTELAENTLNANEQFQHITTAEKTQLLTQVHTHANKAILDQITSAGSGAIITTSERNRVPNANEKKALIGSSGTPSATNPYVTSQDPRLNTVRNPYVTVGPPGSLATFQGVDFRPFEDAVQSITLGAAAAVKAIEVLPGFYTLGGVPIKWQTQNNSILIENFTPGTSILSFQTFAAGIQALLPGTGQLIVRGFTFELNDLGTSGILTQRPNSIIENCIFQPGPTTSNYQIGITLEGANSVVRRCLFRGQLQKGIVISADNCRVEECKFSLSNPNSFGIEVQATANYAFVNHCHFISAKLKVSAGAVNTQISGNHFFTVDGIQNSGFNTRILENLPQDLNQPFVGKKRTVGPTTSYADYRGTDHVAFVEALADPNVTEVEVLDGTYTFSTTVSVPQGKAIRGVTNSSGEVLIQGDAGVKLFTLANRTKLENLEIVGSNTPLVSTENTTGVILQNCKFNLTSFDSADDYAVTSNSIVELKIEKCRFVGARGLKLTNSTESVITENIFASTLATVNMGGACSLDIIKQNHFLNGCSKPQIYGTNSVVTGNLFLGDLPTKLLTLGSIWQGNWPHPKANNDNGVDQIVVSMDKALEPVVNSTRGLIAGTGTIVFPQDIDASAGTSLVELGARLNRAQGFSLKLYWTASLTTGNVFWRITIVFRDQLSKQIGVPITKTISSSRSFLEPNEEELVNLTWTNAEFGLPLNVDPTHVSVTIERLGSLGADTLLTDAHLTEVELTLPRD